MIKGASGPSTLTNGVVDATLIVAKKTDNSGQPLGAESLPPDVTTCPIFSVAPDTGVVCSSVSLTRSAKDISALTNLEAVEPNSDLRPL